MTNSSEMLVNLDSEKFNTDSDAWLSQTAELISDLMKNGISLRKQHTIAPGSRGGLAEVIIDLGTAGAFTAGAGTETFTVISPATGERVGTIPLPVTADLDAAVAAAQTAQRAWAAVNVWDRAAVCRRVADELDRRRDQLDQPVAQFRVGQASASSSITGANRSANMALTET